jgi:HSP20 family molecular chaperone IbpA
MAQLLSVTEEIDRLFDELVHRRWGTRSGITPAQMKVVEDGWVIEVPVEGLSAADIQVHVSGRELWVRGVARRETEQRWGTRLWMRASRNVNMTRSFVLPEPVSAKDVDARVEDGVLRIHIRRQSASR